MREVYKMNGRPNGGLLHPLCLCIKCWWELGSTVQGSLPPLSSLLKKKVLKSSFMKHYLFIYIFIE